MSILDNIENVEETATRLGISTRRVRVLCEEGRLEAKKIGREWAIVAGQENPTDDGFAPKVKITGIKKAVGDFNQATAAMARIYFDKTEFKVWTVEYAEENSWSTYIRNGVDTTEIVEVLSKTTQQDTTSMRELQEICESILEEE